MLRSINDIFKEHLTLEKISLKDLFKFYISTLEYRSIWWNFLKQSVQSPHDKLETLSKLFPVLLFSKTECPISYNNARKQYLNDLCKVCRFIN